MRFVLAICVILLAATPLLAQLPTSPEPGLIPDEPGYWHRWEAEAKTAAAARAATAPPVKLSRDQDLFDVHHYDLDLDIDPVAEILTGTVTMSARVVGPLLRQVDLDFASGMTVDAVRVGGQSAAYEHVLHVISVFLPEDLFMGAEFTVAVDYHGDPSTVANAFGWAWADSQRLVWTLSEPYGAPSWWPCKDVNHDKADSLDLHVEVPAEMVVASNGLLVGEETVGDRRIFHWHESYPICTYLVSVTAYPYVVFTDTYTSAGGQEMPIVNYVMPSYEQAARDGYAVTADIIGAFAEAYGEYPFLDEKYGHAGFTWGGGMEHQTCSSMLYWAFGEGLISHELAHQWWGDLVTCKSFHHIWLNEGFATWSEAYWLEWSQGAQAYHDHLENLRYEGEGTIYVEDPSDFATIFNLNLSYHKAAWVVHMLRGVLGDEDFFAGLALYRERHAYGAADTEEFQAAMEEVSGRDLTAFIQQWIYGERYPRYRFSRILTPQADHTLAQIRIEQIQTWGADVFVMPIRLRFLTDQGDYDVTVENDRRIQHWTFEVPGNAWVCLFDPDDWILCDAYEGGATDVAPTPAALAMTAYPNPFNPQTTLELEVGRAASVRLSVHDAAGRLVRVVADGDLSAGIHRFQWDGRDRAGRAAATGVYFAVAETGGERRTTRLALVK